MKNTRDLAYKDYLSGMKYKDIADKHGVSLSAVKSWASRDWKKVADKKLQPSKCKKVATKQKKSQPKTKASTTAQEVDKIIAEAVEENEELTEKQKDFCRFFVKNRNATQAYLKAYGCSYEVANASGPRLLVNDSIKKEIRKLKEIKNAALGDFGIDDLVELHMRIAFADMTDYTEFSGKRVPKTYKGQAILVKNPKTDEMIPVTEVINTVQVKDSSEVDGQIITEVSEGRDGFKIKRADTHKSLAFLERHFKANPMDRHKEAYDNARLQLEREKLGSAGNFAKEVEDLTPLAELLNDDADGDN